MSDKLASQISSSPSPVAASVIQKSANPQPASSVQAALANKASNQTVTIPQVTK